MAHLSLSLLGPLYATLGDAPITDFGYDHVRALLAYLAVEADRPHRREALAGLLWPNQPDQVALEDLRHALYRLQQAVGNRQASPPFLLISRSALQFNTQSDYSLDVALFENLAGASDDVEGQAPRLERAVGLYRGSFLQGFSLGSSYALEEWLLQKREQLDRQMSAALDQLIQLCQTRGEYERAEGYARRALLLDPWDERIHRQLMLALALRGRRGAALIQYGALQESLRDEFGVEPEPETATLYVRIRANQLDAPASRPYPMAAPAPSLEAARSPFVGRAADLQRLNRCLDHVLDGHGRGALITGETGSGKTMLMAEFAQRAMAAHPQLVVACGSCSAQRGVGDPYLPFREIMQSLSGDVNVPLPNGTIPRAYADRQWAVAPVAIQALAEFGPDLIHRLVSAKPLGLRAESLAHQAPNASDQTKWWEQLHKIIAQPRSDGADAVIPQGDLFSQYTRVLQVIAQAQPILLILDDLQWADSGAISLLFHLSRRLEGQRILLMGAYRSDDAASRREEQRRPLEMAVGEFRRLWEDCEVDLDQAEGHDLVNALLDCEPNRLGPQFRETLYRHTAGHALFAVELLRSLRERGSLRRDSEQFWVEAPDLDWGALPSRVEVMIAERIARLPEASRAILSVASIEGDVFTAEVIARVRGIDEQQVCSVLSRELGARPRLVRPEGLTWRGNQSLSRYRFQHHLFQQYLYNHLDAVERARLHAAVLAALESLHGMQIGALAGALARHAEAAGMAERAAQLWLQAGRHAYALSAHDEATALFRRSLAALNALPDSPERAQIELETQIALAGTFFISRGWGAPERISAADRAYRLCLQLGETKHQLPLLVMLANTSLGRLECRRALAFAEQLLALAQETGQTLYVAAGHHMMGMCLISLGEPRAAGEHLENGLATLLRGQVDLSLIEAPSMGIDMRVSLRLWLSCCLWISGYPNQSREHLAQALQFAEKLGHPPTLAVALAMRCAVLGGMHGEIEAGREHSERLLRLADTNKLPFVRPWGLFYQGWAQALSGQSIEAALQMHSILEALRESGTLATYLQMHCLLSEVYLRLGQVEKGLAVVASALSESEQTGSFCYRAEMLRIKGELLLRACPQDGDCAAVCFMQAVELARRQGARSIELRAAMSLARLRQRQGSPVEARRILAEVYAWFTEGRDTPDLQEARCLLEELGQGAAT